MSVILKSNRKTSFKTIPTLGSTAKYTVFASQSCGRCYGKGYVSCGKCYGSGSYNNEKCSHCGGTGTLPCNSCYGTGQVG